MVKILGLILGLMLCSINAWASTTVPLPITETAGVARSGHPIKVGVPLPSNSGVTSVDNIKLIRNSDQVEIDCQKEVTATWTSGGNIKWVLLDFMADVSASAAETTATATYSVVYGTDVTAGTPSDGVVVTTETGYYLVDAGDLSFKVSRTDSLKIYDVMLGAQAMTSDAWTGKIVVGGVEYNTDNADTYAVTVEKDGTERVTIKCTGTFEDASNNEHFQHVTRIEAFAGQDTIKVYHTIIFDQDMSDPANEPSNMSFSLPLALGNSINAAVGAQSSIVTKTGLGATSNYHLHQKFYNTSASVTGYEIGIDGETPEATGGRSAGWMDVNDGSYGVTVKFRDMWQLYPAEIELDNKALRVHFWPGHDYTAEVNQIRSQVTDGAAGAGSTYVSWPYRTGSNYSLRAVYANTSDVWGDIIHNGIGTARTWETTYYFHAGTHTTASPTAEAFSKAYATELLAWNPEHVVSTQAIPGLADVDTATYPEFEATLETPFDDHIMAFIEAEELYGLNYGDFPYGASDTAVSGDRSFMHHRMEWSRCPWWLFARSGESKYLVYAIANSRHVMDVDLSHIEVSPTTDYAGSFVQKMLGAPHKTHETGPAHYNNLQGYSSLNVTSTTLAMDAKVEPLLIYYYITGYKRGEDVASEMINWLEEAATEYAKTGTNRSNREAAMMGELAYWYSHTWDNTAKTTAESVYDKWAGAPLNEYSVGFQANGMMNDGNFATNWQIMTTMYMMEGFEKYCRLTGDTDAQAKYITWAKAVGGMTLANPHDYYFSVTWPYAYELSSDADFLKFSHHYYDIYRESLASTLFPLRAGSHQYDYYWAYFVGRANKWMRSADSQGVLSANQPYFPPAWLKVPAVSTGDSAKFYWTEEADGEHTIKITFDLSSNITAGNESDSGMIYCKLYDPDGVQIGSTVNYDFGRYSFDKNPTYNRTYRFEGGVDNWTKTFTIPADSKTGEYRIELQKELDQSSTLYPIAFIASAPNQKVRAHLHDNNRLYTTGHYKHWFYVPAGCTGFTLSRSDGGRFSLTKPNGTLYATPTSSYNVTSFGAGETDAYWAISYLHIDPNRAEYITFGGDISPYVYPNPYYGAAPADPGGASGIKIKSDRWPDFETLKTFGDSAAVLMGAVTDTEKALAVFRYVQASTVIPGPLPKSGNYASGTPLVYGDLLLNVYGGYDCAGQGEIMSSVWRRMGYKARTIQPDSGHTQADLAWTDSDSVERYHLFDASGNRLFLWNRAGTNLVSHDDVVVDPSLLWRPENLSLYPTAPKAGTQYSSWWDIAHLRYPSQLTGEDYSRLFDLRQNESVQFYFGNDTNRLKYVSSGLDQAGGVTDIKHGPYPKVQGTALWTLSPDLTTAGWEDGLESATNLTTDTGPLVHPTATGTASSVYHFQFPYPVADVEIDAAIVRGASDTFKVYVSKDGTTWVEKYAAPSGSTNLTARSLVVDVSGTATGGSTGTNGGGYDIATLDDSSKTWTANEWVQASATHPNSQTDHTILRNVTTGKSCIALTNTTNSITCYAEAHPVTFTSGDAYTITEFPTSSTPVFGRYDYYLKIEMVAASTPTTVGFSALTIRNYTQHNLFSLPQLWPVDNDITVSGSVLGGSKLKVTYQWDDEQGSNRQNIAEIVTPPFTYTIKADSAHWPSVNAGINGTGVKCDFIKIECVPKEVGDTNQITTQEAAPSATTDILPTDAYATSDILLGVINTTGTAGYAYPTIRTASQYRSDLATALAANSFTADSPPGVRWTLYGMMDLNTQDAGERASNKTSIEVALEHLYDYQGTVKPAALAAYCQADNYGSDCVTMCGRVLNRDPDMKWADYAVSGDMSSQVTWHKTAQSAALILSRIKTPEAQAYSDEIAAILALNYYTGAYFKIITGANDTATLTCPAGNGTITVTPGAYTGAQLATEVQTQMNANATLIDDGSVSYTVTYNSSTRKFTIAASAGTIAYNRTTYKSQLMRDLGWTASATSAASITSNDVTFDNSTYNYMITAMSRALGNLKNGTACSEAERSALSTFISGPYYDASAAEALGKCGAAGDITTLQNMISVAIANTSGNLKILRPMIAIGNLGDSTHAPDFYGYTTHWDEDFRGYSAEALGKLGNQDAVTYITAARAVEPVGWVQDIQDAALALLGEIPDPPPAGPYKNHGAPKSFIGRPTL